ncbi:uncharacterized protein LOC113502703 [Trichoplusia ni]|uniref:Uncharacterized protein LOC113502703 n=1 Tax=Trichoplusia ni TaxID=7111 RepID=A0A7E5WJ39_TRINI|nr:uncharacterized protein LOC113502703 [Trichoplusia ni]
MSSEKSPPKTPIARTTTQSDSDILNAMDGENVNITTRCKRPRTELSSPEIESNSLRDMIRQEIQSALQDAMKCFVQDQLNTIRDMVSEFKKSLSFFNEKYEAVKITLEEKSIKIQKLEKDNYDLQSSLKDMTMRVNILEQQARSSNIEMQCVPEHRAENLVSTVLQLSRVIGCDIKETDIQLCTRTAKKDKQNTRPRSVLVKFNSPRLRDTFLAASIQFNKTNSSDKLNSSHLGIATDKPVPIFITEHLSPENKALHAATRVRAKELGFKFVWVRNGRVFMKKDEHSQSLLIRDHENLKLLT